MVQEHGIQVVAIAAKDETTPRADSAGICLQQHSGGQLYEVYLLKI